jgi:hypothetical protein
MKHLVKTVVSSTAIALVAIYLTGCSQTPTKVDPNYALYVSSQRDIKMAEAAADRPLVDIVAREGESIEIKGVKEFRVYAPQNGSQNMSAQITPYQPPVNQNLELAKAIIGAAAPIGQILAVGKAGSNMIDAITKGSTTGYQYVQAPAPNITIGGNGVIGSGSFSSSDLSGTGTIGSGTYSSLSGTGVLGAGTLSSLTGTGTTGTGTYAPTVTNAGGTSGTGTITN